MRISNHSHYLLGDTAAPAGFGRITRISSAPAHLAGVSTVSANEPDIKRPGALGASALEALAANGFDDAAIERRGIHAALAAMPLYAAARIQRSQAIGELIASAVQAVSASFRRVAAKLRRQHDEYATYRALAQLDARTLKDIGLDRSGIRWVAHRIARGDPAPNRPAGHRGA